MKSKEELELRLNEAKSSVDKYAGKDFTYAILWNAVVRTLKWVLEIEEVEE